MRVRGCGLRWPLRASFLVPLFFSAVFFQVPRTPDTAARWRAGIWRAACQFIQGLSTSVHISENNMNSLAFDVRVGSVLCAGLGTQGAVMGIESVCHSTLFSSRRLLSACAGRLLPPCAGHLFGSRLPCSPSVSTRQPPS